MSNLTTRQRNERAWVFFKWSIYALGITFILIEIALNNLGIIWELLYFHRLLFAFIVYELTIMLFPVWVITLNAIVREGIKELKNYEKSTDTSGNS